VPDDLARERVVAEDAIAFDLRVVRRAPVQVQHERATGAEQSLRELHAVAEVRDEVVELVPTVVESDAAVDLVQALGEERRVAVDERERCSALANQPAHARDVVGLQDGGEHSPVDAATAS
jgi:hypothetical protein